MDNPICSDLFLYKCLSLFSLIRLICVIRGCFGFCTAKRLTNDPTSRHFVFATHFFMY